MRGKKHSYGRLWEHFGVFWNCDNGPIVRQLCVERNVVMDVYWNIWSLLEYDDGSIVLQLCMGRNRETNKSKQRSLKMEFIF